MRTRRGARRSGVQRVEPVGRRVEGTPGDRPDLWSNRSGYAWVDHTSEATLRLRGPTFAALLEEAARAFVSLVPGHLGGDGPEADDDDDAASGAWRELTLEEGDAASVLVGWLNELVYLAEVERWVPTEVALEAGVDEQEDVMSTGPVRVRARGRTLEQPFVLVKAATLHGAKVRSRSGHLEAEVTLDI
ncbi:MAG: archease [Gemmatimonadota bacterium]|nr:archease [Gemmatimonadota bacterium]